MKQLIFFFISFFILISCNKFIGGQSSSMNFCDSVSLKITIQLNWKYEQNGNYFITNDSFIQRLNSKYKNCIIGSDTFKISVLFGNNYRISSDRKTFTNQDTAITALMCYSISPPCKGKSSSCYFLYFFFDNSGKIVFVRKGKDTISSSN